MAAMVVGRRRLAARLEVSQGSVLDTAVRHLVEFPPRVRIDERRRRLHIRPRTAHLRVVPTVLRYDLQYQVEERVRGRRQVEVTVFDRSADGPTEPKLPDLVAESTEEGVDRCRPCPDSSQRHRGRQAGHPKQPRIAHAEVIARDRGVRRDLMRAAAELQGPRTLAFSMPPQPLRGP